VIWKAADPALTFTLSIHGTVQPASSGSTAQPRGINKTQGPNGILFFSGGPVRRARFLLERKGNVDLGQPRLADKIRTDR
jgi:hypothetical protein